MRLKFQIQLRVSINCVCVCGCSSQTLTLIPMATGTPSLVHPPLFLPPTTQTTAMREAQSSSLGSFKSGFPSDASCRSKDCGRASCCTSTTHSVTAGCERMTFSTCSNSILTPLSFTCNGRGDTTDIQDFKISRFQAAMKEVTQQYST